MFKTFFFWISAVLFAALAAVFVSVYTLSSQYKNEAGARDEAIERKLEKMIEDQAGVARYLNAFPGPHQNKDAGHILNFKVQWTGDVYTKPGEAINRLKALKNEEWLELLDEPELYAHFSTAWMQYLKNYDYWELFENSPVESLLLDTPVNGFSIPVPDDSILLAMARIRLLQGMKSNRPREALLEVRHLARLLSTQEVMNSLLVSIAILNSERSAVDWLVAHHQMKAQSWDSLPKEQAARSKEAVFASFNLFNVLDLKQNSWSRLLAAKPIGLCAGLTEGIEHAALIRSLIENHQWLETDYRPGLKHLDEIVHSNASACRLVLGHAQWENYWHHLKPEFFWMDGDEPPLHLKILFRLADLPYLRSFSVSFLNARATPVSSYWKTND